MVPPLRELDEEFGKPGPVDASELPTEEEIAGILAFLHELLEGEDRGPAPFLGDQLDLGKKEEPLGIEQGDVVGSEDQLGPRIVDVVEKGNDGPGEDEGESGVELVDEEGFFLDEGIDDMGNEGRGPPRSKRGEVFVSLFDIESERRKKEPAQSIILRVFRQVIHEENLEATALLEEGLPRFIA